MFTRQAPIKPHPFRTLSRFLLIGLVFVLVWLYAQHEVAGKLNQRAADRQLSLDQLSHHLQWSLDSGTDLVGAYANDWRMTDDGIVSMHSQPVMSLNLAGQALDPVLYQQLLIDLAVQGSRTAGSEFRLEFARQSESVHYYSPVFDPNTAPLTIRLTEHRWQQLDAQGKPVGASMAWSELGELDSLVVRFYLTEGAAVEVRRMGLQQTQARQWAMPKTQDCEHTVTWPWVCWLTNQMIHLDQMHNTGSSVQHMAFPVLTDWMPAIWLVLAWLVVLLVVWLIRPQALKVVWGLVTLVFALIYVLHQPVMLSLTIQLRYVVMLLALVLLFTYARRIWRVQHSAWPVLLATALLAAAAFFWLSIPLSSLNSLPAYFVWALVQQTLLGPVFSDELKSHLQLSNATTAWLVGVLFAIIHAPNQALMLATLVGGVVWSASWLLYRNIYVNAVSHAVLALLFYAVSPDAWLGSARIGMFF
jgi:hypothetical protein